MRFLYLAALALPCVLAATPIPYKNCGSSSDLVNIKTATADPWPPQQGAAFSVNLDATLSKNINGGQYRLKVSFDSLPIIDKTGPYTDLNVTLPIKAGHVNIAKTVNFPKIGISGSIDVTVSGTDENGAEVLCLELPVDLVTKKAAHRHHDKKDDEVVPVVILNDPVFGNTNVPFTDCGESSSPVSITSLAADIWPPQKGKDVTLFINADAKEEIASGNYDAKVSFDGFQVVDESGSLASLGLTLPIKAGPIVAKKTLAVPNVPLSGKVNIKATATDGSSDQLFCVSVDTQI